MAVSFNDLYNTRVKAFGSEPVDQATYKALHEGAYAGAMADYKDLTGGTGASAPATTLRNINTPLPKPVMPSSSFGAVKGGSVGAGTSPGGLPAYDESKVEGLAQRFAAPGIRKLRNAVQETQQGYYENHNVKRMTLRDSLAGYGQGLESVMGGALEKGASVYGQQYGAQVQAKLQSNQIASNESMQAASIASNERTNQYNNEWRAYLASLS
jgi:hypothetical protein